MEKTFDSIRYNAEILHCSFKIEVRTSEWKRLYIMREDGASIGRMSFNHDQLFSVKFYKRYGMYDYDIDESDWVYLSWIWFQTTGTEFKRSIYEKCIEDAQIHKLIDYKRRLKERELRPKFVNGKKINRRSIKFGLLWPFVMAEFRKHLQEFRNAENIKEE